MKIETQEIGIICGSPVVSVIGGRPDEVFNWIDTWDASETFLLILEDIDQAWCSAFCSRYSDSLDWMFLARHIVRAGDQGGSVSRTREREYCTMVEKVERHLFSRCHSMASEVERLLEIHIDCLLDSVSDSLRWEYFLPPHSRQGNFREQIYSFTYGKLSTRISCLQLADHMCRKRYHASLGIKTNRSKQISHLLISKCYP